MNNRTARCSADGYTHAKICSRGIVSGAFAARGLHSRSSVTMRSGIPGRTTVTTRLSGSTIQYSSIAEVEVELSLLLLIAAPRRVRKDLDDRIGRGARSHSSLCRAMAVGP